MSYCGFITRIKDLRKHSNADRLQVGSCFGNSVIVDLKTAENDLGVYFPTDGRLGMEFCEANNLLRINDENGKNIGGYLEPHKRHISTLKLRGEFSDGLFLPLICLEKFTDISKLKEGDMITVLNGIIICEKYVVSVNRRSSNKNNNIKKSKKIIAKKHSYPLFREHIDTNQLAYNLHQFKEGDICSITLKLHGCFRKDTPIKIWGKKNQKRICNIKIGDLVVGYDEENKQYIPSKVTNIFINGKTKEWIYIKISRNGHSGKKHSIIKCTPNHKFFKNKEYVEAKYLVINDIIQTVKGLVLNGEFKYINIDNRIIDIYYVTTLRDENKYDIETETNNYIVHDCLVHNSSGRTSNTIKESKYLFYGLLYKITKFLHIKLPVRRKYENVSGTRRTILKDYNGGYYGSNAFRFKYHEFFKNKLHKGETIYYEIVGYVNGEKSIMPVYNNKKVKDKKFSKLYGETTTFAYGCEIGLNDIYAYRMTITNEDGDEVEYSHTQMKIRCDQMGVKTCPMFERFIFTDKDDLNNRVDKYINGVDPIGKNHIREGIVVRIENSDKFKVFKAKNIYFKILEGIIKEENILDMEEENSETDQEGEI